MMPHANCILTGCRLNSVQNLTGLELPKFPIGAVVSCRWVDEFDQVHENQGWIIGMFPAPKDWLPGWWYVVRRELWDTAIAIQIPTDEEWHELELKPLSQDKAIESD